MSRKDYVAIALALHEVIPAELIDVDMDNRPRYHEGRIDQFNACYSVIVGVLANDNPRFDRERFRHAVFHGE